jgi:hypothetical protein
MLRGRVRTVFLFASTSLAACSQQEPKRENSDLRTYDVQEEASATAMNTPPPPPPPVMAPAPLNRDAAPRADGAGPNVGVTAAPGVAFNYRYAFRMPNERIEAAQEAHAQMCERLGVGRCRITGLRYNLSEDGDVAASLEFKLDPAIARVFGKQATKLVTESKGMLVDLAISGIDAGGSIERANRGRAGLQDELDRVNRELGRSGLSSVVRDRLLSEAAALRSQIRALGEQKAADEESLATTPMAFHYGSGETIGYAEHNPLSGALDRAGYNFLSAIGLLVVALATLLPWLLLIAAGLWLYRRYAAGRFPRAGHQQPEPASQ